MLQPDLPPLFPYTAFFRSDDEARCASPLPDAAAHVRAAGAGTCRDQGRSIPEASSGSGSPNVRDRKSTRLNSSHANNSYGIFRWTKKIRLHLLPASCESTI